MFFTQEDYRKIEKWLLSNSIKDTEFVEALTPLQGNETLAFVQKGKNVKVFLKDLIDQIFLLGVSDFLNISDKYKENYISLNQAIALVPNKSRKIGQVITFLNQEGVWKIYQFQGTKVNQWNNTTLWIDLIQQIQGLDIIDSEDIIPKISATNQTSLLLADKSHNPDNYSGLGRIYLRKNIQRVQNPSTGVWYVTNILTQSMINKENTIYIIQYDYDLNGQEITVPENCILKFEGGSLSCGIIKGNNTKIKAGIEKIFGDNITINGTWNVEESYPEWFGAVGDGVTNDTIALTKCINYFTVTFLSARIYITDQINDIPSFKTIKGCGKKSIIQANPSMELTNSHLLRTKDGGSGIIFSDFVLLGGSNSTEANYKIGGIALRSTSNDVNDQWDTRNIIQNVEIKNCYAASIYIGTYQRENKIQNCFISNTTNNGINCQGTDNMINGCTIAGSHLSGIMLQGNNRLSNTKLFGCGKSEVTKNLYALDIFGSKCNVSNVELQQNYYGGVIVRGNSNYVQVTNDNNGSGNPTGTTTGASIIGNYNTVIVTSYNFSFHDDAYERYFVSTNWSTIGNNIIVNGTPLKNNKMSSLSPWSIDNICNNINWNGYNLTQDREVSFDKLVIPYKYRTNGTGSFYTNDTGLSFNITSVTAVNADALSYSIPIYNATKVDPDGCFSIKARFHKNNDADDSIYPVIRINTIYKNSAGTSIKRTDQNTMINLLDNKDSLDVYTLSSYYHLSDKAVSISSISIELAVRSTKILSDVSIDAYFDDIKIGATTSGDTIRFINTNIDGTSGNKVVIANEISDFTLENVIYKIVSDINLGTAALEIPSNCTLDFQGGSFSNGTINFNQTTLINPNFSSCRFKGSILNQQLNIDDFGAIKGDENFDNSVIINDLINLKKRDAYAGAKTIFVPSGAYYIKNSIQLYDYWNSNIVLKGEGLSSVISQITDNIPIIKSYETTVISDLRLIYKNWQPVTNTNATAIAVQRAVRSTFENLQIINAQKGFGYITLADQQSEQITNLTDQTYVNANTRNVGIYQCSGYAIDLRKEMSQNDSGSIYDNIYISSSHPINGYDASKPSQGAIYMGGSSMTFTQLNIESKYSDTLIMSTSLTNYLTIANLHIEGLTTMRTIYKQVAGQGFFDIGNIDIDRCAFTTNNLFLFYFSVSIKFNIDLITLRSSCTIPEGNQWFIFQQDNGTSYGRLGNHSYPAGMAPTRVNNSYDHIVLRIDRSDFLVTYGSQDEFTTPSTNNWLLYAGGNTLAYLYNKAIYIDNNGDYRYPDGYLARLNGVTIRRSGTTAQRPTLDNTFIGFTYYDTTIQKFIMWNGTAWRNMDGTALLVNKGTTAERPTITVNGWGYQYYDNDLKKPIWWDGTAWKDATGATV